VQAQIAEVDANLAERKIVAPSDGTILSRPVEVGNVVSAGSPVFVMVDMNWLYVKVYIPEPDIPKIKLGDPADVSVDAFPGRTFPARVTKIYQMRFELGLEKPDPKRAFVSNRDVKHGPDVEYCEW
jgi:HlyD family secretion protein